MVGGVILYFMLYLNRLKLKAEKRTPSTVSIYSSRNGHCVNISIFPLFYSRECGECIIIRYGFWVATGQSSISNTNCSGATFFAVRMNEIVHLVYRCSFTLLFFSPQSHFIYTHFNAVHIWCSCHIFTNSDFVIFFLFVPTRHHSGWGSGSDSDWHLKNIKNIQQLSLKLTSFIFN